MAVHAGVCFCAWPCVCVCVCVCIHEILLHINILLRPHSALQRVAATCYKAAHTHTHQLL